MRYLAAIAISLGLLVGQAHASPDCANPYVVARYFGTYEGQQGLNSNHAGWNPRWDLNDDGAVTIGDIIIALNCWPGLTA